MKKFVIALMSTALVSCIAGVGNYKLVDDEAILAEGVDLATPVPLERVLEPLNEEQRGQFTSLYGDGPYFAVPEEYVAEGARTIPFIIDPEEGGDPNKETSTVDEVVEAVGGVASTIFPQFAPFLPAVLLLFKRPRKHLANAAKKAIPYPGNSSIDLPGATVDIARAIGLVHSSPASEAAAEGASKTPTEA